MIKNGLYLESVSLPINEFNEILIDGYTQYLDDRAYQLYVALAPVKAMNNQPIEPYSTTKLLSQKTTKKVDVAKRKKNANRIIERFKNGEMSESY